MARNVEIKARVASDAEAVFGWLLALDYPWTNAQRVVAGAPPLEDLAPVVQYLLHPM